MILNPTRVLGWLAATMVCAALAVPALAQFGPKDVVKLSVKAPPKVVAGKPAQLQITLTIKPGFHIQADTAKSPYIPAKIEIVLPKGYKAGKLVFPKAKTAHMAGDTLAVFEGKTVVHAIVTPPAGARGIQKLTVKLSYQACDATSCYPPSDASATATMKIAAPKKGAKRSAAVPAAGPAPADPPAASATTPGIPAGYAMTKVSGFKPPAEFVKFLQAGGASHSGENAVTKRLSGNLGLALLVVFALGLALNLTPCVYPIIPITISYFGGQASQTGRKPFVLAIFYVLGMAAMYSTLGVVAGMSHGVFGAQLQNPWVLGVFAIVMFALALSQFDRPDGRPIWELQLPASLRNSSGPRTGIIGAVLMGLLVGVVAAPCVGPAVVALLQFVAAKGSPVLGFALFFTLSIGLGLPYLVLATVSGSVKRLPRSGEWMLGVKHIFGVVLIAMGFYYLGPVLDRIAPHVGTWTLAVVVWLGALYLLFVDRAGAKARAFSVLKRVIAVLAIAGTVPLLMPAPKAAIRWHPLTDEALAQAVARHRSVLIDFGAEWCVECKQLDRSTFTDPRVGAAARDFVAFKGDMTDANSERSQEWAHRFQVAGLPTVVRLVPE